MTASFAGPDVDIKVGDIVEGTEAVRFLTAGYAVAVVEDETASVTPVFEKAVKARKPKA